MARLALALALAFAFAFAAEQTRAAADGLGACRKNDCIHAPAPAPDSAPERKRRACGQVRERARERERERERANQNEFPDRLLAGTPSVTPATPRACASVSGFAAAHPLSGETGGDIPTPTLDGTARVALARAYLAQCGSDEAARLTQALIRLPTVSSERDGAARTAFADLSTLLAEFARAHGLGFATFGDGEVFEVTLGGGERQLGFVVHADVVAAHEGADAAAPWGFPPFAGVIDDGKLYGRGAQDDKGPLAAALIVLAALGEAGLSSPERQLLVIIGTGEEHDWDAMLRYAGTRTPPRYALSADAEFPVVTSEDGFVAWHLALPIGARKSANKAVIVNAGGGTLLTQVPAEAFMTIAKSQNEKLEALTKRVQTAVETERRARANKGAPFRLAVEPDPASGTVTVRAFGVAVHSSQAELGFNALWPLATLAQRMNLERNGFSSMLAILARRFDGDHFGDKLGLAYSDPVMGRLLVTPTVLGQDDERVTLGVNMRRPSGPSSVEFSAKLDQALGRLQRDFDRGLSERPERFVGEPVRVAPSEPLVQTLLAIYRELATAPEAQAASIRGGTYARLFPGGVSFGPALPGQAYRGHAPNEYISLAELGLLTRALGEAALRLMPQAPAPAPSPAP